MNKIYFNSRDELIAVDFEQVAVIQANGNYTRIIYINKHEVMLSMGITKVSETLLKHKFETARFIRIGRSCIINHAFLERIDIPRLLIVLTDGNGHEIRLNSSKQVLKSYKASVTNVKNNTNNPTASER
jgi:DNA-binding LytR/AlgR family response regulator